MRWHTGRGSNINLAVEESGDVIPDLLFINSCDVQVCRCHQKINYDDYHTCTPSVIGYLVFTVQRVCFLHLNDYFSSSHKYQQCVAWKLPKLLWKLKDNCLFSSSAWQLVGGRMLNWMSDWYPQQTSQRVQGHGNYVESKKKKRRKEEKSDGLGVSVPAEKILLRTPLSALYL